MGSVTCLQSAEVEEKCQFPILLAVFIGILRVFCYSLEVKVPFF